MELVHAASCSPAHHPRGGKASQCEDRHPLGHKKTITYSNEGHARGLITDVETLSVSFRSHSLRGAGIGEEGTPTLKQPVGFLTLAAPH